MLIFDILKTLVSTIVFLILRVFEKENIEQYWKSYLTKAVFTLSIYASVFPNTMHFKEFTLFAVT